MRSSPLAPAPPEELATNRETVIIIDADGPLLRALRFSLELEGYCVQTHRSGAALHLMPLPLSKACLVIDHRLAGDSGLNLLQRLRADHVELPAILMTSHPNEILKARARTLGAVTLEKPMLGDALVLEIREALAGAAEPALRKTP
jgi:two-component system response regulator FixJ